MGGDELTLWRVELRLRGPTLSAWQADTLWGHLCWALRHRRGEAALCAWLDRYRSGDPPLLVSDGFAGEMLPAPLFPVAAGEPPAEKAARRARWLTRAEFRASVAAGRIVLDGEQAEGWQMAPTWRNTVSRVTGSSLAERDSGGLFVLQERWAPGGRVSIYARVGEADLPLARELFEALTLSGFGKRRAVGYGAIAAVTWQEERELDAPPPGANGFVTLSAFVPRPADPARGAWELDVKHGRFSEEMPGAPWKAPLLRLTTGSSFFDAEARLWYGGLVEGIAVDASTPARRNAVQCAYAFPVPARLEEGPGEE